MQLLSVGTAFTPRQDLLHRFTATSHTIDLRLMRRTIRIETNNESVLHSALNYFGSHQDGLSEKPSFIWRIVCEADRTFGFRAVPLTAFSDLGLRYVNIGQRSFLSVNLNQRQAACYLAEGFFESDARLRHRPPLDILFCLTAASLGLTSLSGGCVSTGDRGVLVFGPPNSGKTTACYLAAKSGMEFQADQVVFLDMSHPNLSVWGDPFPAVFRPETLEFLPALRESTYHSNYANLSFYYFNKSMLQSQSARPISSMHLLFLHRDTACATQLTEASAQYIMSRLREYLLFEENPEFEEQAQDALTALVESAPAYHLTYDSDPTIAANVIDKLLR
jgi:hypothetical protein